MKFKQKCMVQWYDARQLASTGIKTVISTIFGNFADKREMQAVLSEEAPFDYSKHDHIWIDYIADLGDGFNSTYTMADLMAREQLEVNGVKIKRGDILIMGGDQVYPTPEKQEYENRLQGPYNAAYPWDNNTDLPHLFALPGNHDWYDGLTNFIKLFCQGRALGNWHTQQKRSYFALKLPYRIWIWGIDVQLSSDIDQPQRDYFQTIADGMLPGDRVILCTAEPAWVYRSLTKKDLAYERLEFFKTNYIVRHGFALLAMLTGDLHHYSHYEITDVKGNRSHYITAGGGGAFMHPTHFLKDKLEVKKGVPIEGVQDSELITTFPLQKTSEAMAYRNLFFPVLNWRLTFLLGFFFLIMCWFLQSNTKFPGVDSFMESIAPCGISDISNAGNLIRKSLAHNPSVVMLNLVLFFGILGFTDTKLGKGRWNLVAGFAHALTQLLVFYLLVWFFSRINLDREHLQLYVEDPWQVLLFSGEMIIAGGAVSSFVFGVYLLVSILVFKCHPTEAFSSLRWTGYKNFLRIHITKDKVTVYPIGVKKVVTNWKKEGPEDKPRFTGGPAACDFIEKPFDI